MNKKAAAGVTDNRLTVAGGWTKLNPHYSLRNWRRYNWRNRQRRPGTDFRRRFPC